MEAHDPHAGEHQPDTAGAETGPIVPPEPEADSPERSTEESAQPDPQSARSSVSSTSTAGRSPSVSSSGATTPSSPSTPEVGSSQGSSDPTPERSSSESETPSDEPDGSSAEEERGLLTGTGAEELPGTGSAGTHPAPAAVRDPERGDTIHVAGEPPAGTIASSVAGADLPDVRSGDDVDPEAREKLNEPSEPEQVHIDRPDLGTE